jgi:flagellar motor switch protein FliM
VSAAVQTVSLTEKPSASCAGLDAVAADFVGALSAALGVTAGDPPVGEVSSFGEVRDRAEGVFVSITFRMVPLKGSVIIAVPLALVQALVDLDYGGDGRFSAERKDMLPSERRAFERFEALAVKALADAWKKASGAEVNAIRLEMLCGFPNSLALDTEVVAHRFDLTLGKAKPHGCLLVTPTALLRALPLNKAPTQDNTDPAWKSSFAEAVMQVRLPVRTIFARPELPLERLLSLQPGEIIPLHLSERLPVIVGGARFAEGSIGEANGRAAIRIERTLEGTAPHE